MRDRQAVCVEWPNGGEEGNQSLKTIRSRTPRRHAVDPGKYPTAQGLGTDPSLAGG